MSPSVSWPVALNSSRLGLSMLFREVVRPFRCPTYSSTLKGIHSLRVPMTKKRSCAGVIMMQTAILASLSSVKVCAWTRDQLLNIMPMMNRKMMNRPMLRMLMARLEMIRRQPETVKKRTTLRGLKMSTRMGSNLTSSNLQVLKRRTRTVRLRDAPASLLLTT